MHFKCNNPQNPAGIGTQSGVSKNRCGDHSNTCILNGGRAEGKCAFYDSSHGKCNNPQNPAGIGTRSGVSSDRCGNHCDQCEILKNQVTYTVTFHPY
jgi:hypothetical protein